MSENDKKDFEFIKEQVIEKRRKKIKKRLMPFIMTVGLAILFGIIAAVTFVLTEPRLYELLHKEEETKTPATFPTEYPEDSETEEGTSDITVTPDPKDNISEGAKGQENSSVPSTVIINNQIVADLKDFTSMYGKLRDIADDADKALVKVVGITKTEDVWFNTPVELKKETTGLIVHNDNVNLLILASLDRVKDADSIQVELSGAYTVDATIQDYESELNLAVIAVPLKAIPVSFLNNIKIATLGESYSMIVGTPIIAMGSPNGHVGSMEFGFISSGNNTAYITDGQMDLFNTDIDVNDNSDGIIINTRGEVIGLITRVIKDEVSEGLNTNIGISKLKPLLKDLVNQEPRIYFGVKTENMGDEIKSEHGITNGIFVNEVIEDSPAYIAGIQAGDIIIQVNTSMVMDTNNFYNIISAMKPDEEADVRVRRTAGKSDRDMTITIKLTKKEK